MSPGFHGGLDRSVAHAVHALACFGDDPLVAPGYRRADARLRSALGQTPPTPDGADGPIEALLTEPLVDLPDTAWFDQRWAGGERDACATHAADAAARANAFPCPRLLGDVARREVLVATPLRPVAVGGVTAAGVRVIGGPNVSGTAIVMAAIAARLAQALPLSQLDLDDARFVRLQCAGSALLRSGDADAHLDTLLESAALDLPAPHHGDTLEARVARIAPCLDQPPGELERLGRGLSRRYPDRLHRTWLRGVFVPRGFDLDAWISALKTRS